MVNKKRVKWRECEKLSIAEKVREIIQGAIERVSDGGQMKFSVRNLYYAVREIYLKRWTNEKFYKYNSFTQDFMRAYEKKNGKVQGLVREARGSYQRPDAGGWCSEDNIKTDTYFWAGIGNKVVVVEKSGLYEVMKQNKFDVRLDAVIMTTQGFTTEAGREILKMAEKKGLPICILHDYDINGILIHNTLKQPTKRLDSYITNIIDLGLTWDLVKELMNKRGLTPEPVHLSKQDTGKLRGMWTRGEITGGDDEFNFLESGRIELNALTPLELLTWLEERLEDLDLWKTVPKQDELDEKLKEDIISDLDDTKDTLVNGIVSDVKDKIGITTIEDLLGQMEEAITSRTNQEVGERFEGVDYPTITVGDFEEKLRADMLQYWTKLCGSLAGKEAEKLEEPIKEEVEEDRADIIEDSRQDEQVQDYEDLLNNAFAGWLSDRGL